MNTYDTFIKAARAYYMEKITEEMEYQNEEAKRHNQGMTHVIDGDCTQGMNEIIDQVLDAQEEQIIDAIYETAQFCETIYTIEDEAD